MKQRYLIFLLVLLTVSTACGSKTRPTPTPFAEDDATEQALNAATPQAISIADLAADPEAYADSFVKLTGQYQRRPLLVCDTDPYPAPATWQLEAADGSLVAVGGFDSQVRSLLPNNLTMTVVGVWQLFDGPVGCGKSATNSQIWYLKASDILSPSPIARVTLTPTGSGTQVAEGEEGTAVSNSGNNDTIGATPTLADNSNPSVGTPTQPGGTTSASPEPGNGTPGIVPTENGGGSGAASTPSPTSSGADTTATTTISGTATPTTTSGSGTATPTGSSGGTGGNPTPTTSFLTTATPNPNNFDTVEFDPLSPEKPVLEFLETEQSHLFPILFDYNGAITVTAVGESSLNLVLEIIDQADNLVQQANSGGNGELETIVNAQLNVTLNYQIRVYNLNDIDGDYCLIFHEGGGFPDTIKGRIEYGQTVTNQVEVLGIDYWCFLGSSGDTVSISSSATGSSGDFVLGLFGPPDFEAIGPAFQDDTITNASLSEDSMYIIGVLDFEAEPSGYSLTLTKN